MVDDSVSRRRWLTALGATGVAGLAGCTGDDGGQGTTTTTASDETDGGMTETTATTTEQASTSGSVKIGVLQPTSGDLQYYGQQALWGFYSGLAYKGDTDPIEEATTGSHTTTVNGTEYELLVRDTKFSADTAQSVATDLVENEDVDMLFGGTSSGA